MELLIKNDGHGKPQFQMIVSRIRWAQIDDQWLPKFPTKRDYLDPGVERTKSPPMIKSVEKIIMWRKECYSICIKSFLNKM